MIQASQRIEPTQPLAPPAGMLSPVFNNHAAICHEADWSNALNGWSAMQTRYEKPVDPDHLRRRRQQVVADRVFRWTHAVVGDDEVVSIWRCYVPPAVFGTPD